MRREIYAAALLETWAIRSEWLYANLELASHAAPSKAKKLPSVKGNIAVLPMHGAISQRASIWQDIFGGTSTEQFGAAFVRAINDDRIGAVVINQDSAGGTTAGVEELGDLIHQGSKIKTVVALANSESASAAYWLGSQATTMIAAPGSEVGSVGVYRMHVDESQAMEQVGVKVRFLSVPEYKTEGNPYEPMSADAIAHHMEQVSQTYDIFTKAVARGRGITAAKVKADFGKGRSFHAAQAASLGMVDRVATLAQVIGELSGGGKADVVTSAASDALASLCEAWESGVVESIRKPLSRRERSERLFSKI